MRFLNIITGAGNAPPSAEHQARMGESIAEEVAAGRMLATGGLGRRATSAARIIRKGGKTTVEDPPSGDGWMAASGFAITEAPKAKAVIADLPVGYYPLQPSEKYDTQATTGRSFVHQLLIEKSLDFVTDDGWVYLIVPANVMTGEQAKSLLKFAS